MNGHFAGSVSEWGNSVVVHLIEGIHCEDTQAVSCDDEQTTTMLRNKQKMKEKEIPEIETMASVACSDIK